MNKQLEKAIKNTDPWNTGWKKLGKNRKSRGNRRAAKIICRETKAHQ